MLRGPYRKNATVRGQFTPIGTPPVTQEDAGSILVAPAIFLLNSITIASTLRPSIAYRHWPIHGTLRDSGLDRHTLPDDFAGQSLIYRNDLDNCSADTRGCQAQAASVGGPALIVCFVAYVPIRP